MVSKRKDEEAIFNAALQLESREQQESFLAEACGNDRRLRADVEALLKAHFEAESLLDKPLLGPDITLGDTPSCEGPGTKIGKYKLVELIGEGGFGHVYMAQQEEHIDRKVALKIIKLGMDTKQVIARFEAERQALAMMEHPNIAKVLDAGSTDAGRPYFVMELVRGIPITEYCDKNNLSTQQRLELFIKVCRAVQHAHQKGIIHRDIKPSNVMITLRDDGTGVPKIIDFGIAKATQRRLTEKTLFTEYHQFIGTPEYMSPEQAQMGEVDVDTRTDIYSLGVLLYELLTGVTPFSEEQLREAGYLEMQRIIREEEPTKPSTKLSTLGDTLTDVAEHRKTSPDLLQKLVRGDLDWIVMKLLEKDRTRRYDTAAELIADIARHLNNEPVSAGPPSQIYRLRKFMRRHRTHSISAVIVAVLLAGMTVISAMYIQAHNRGEEVESLKHKEFLSKAMEFRSKGQFQEALTKVETVANSEHVGPEARLLRAQLILELRSATDALQELERLLDERDEISGQAHSLMAKIYYEGDPIGPGRTEQYRLKWEYHRKVAEKLLPETADAYLLQAISAGTVPKALDLLDKALELDKKHYESLRERAYLSYANKDYFKMFKDSGEMIGIQPENPVGYALRAISQRELRQFDEAMEDHNKAIEISPDDPELYDQRWQTYMRMGEYELALSDIQMCVQLKPEVSHYHCREFCTLTALGRYDEAGAKYDTIIDSGLMNVGRFAKFAAKYVSDTLDAGLSWYPPERKPEGAAFLAMHESAEVYRQLAAKGKRVVAEGFHASWSPDGNELVYSHGFLASSGIAILNLQSGNTRLLAFPGKDPAWSPDGKYIAYVRGDRRILPVGRLVAAREGVHIDLAGEEIWLMKADGTDEPRFLAMGGWPCWSADSKRILYGSWPDSRLYSIPIEVGRKATPIIPCPHGHPAVSPDEKYVAYRTNGPLKIVDVSTNSIVASWTVPSILSWWACLISWSPDGQKLSVSEYVAMGLWVYDVKEKRGSKLLNGTFEKCSWSSDMKQIAIGRTYAGLHHEIWVADTASLGPYQTVEEHLRGMIEYYNQRIECFPEDAKNYLLRAGCHIHLRDPERASADMETCARLLKSRDHPATAVVTKLQENCDDVDAVFLEVLAEVMAYSGRILGPKNAFVLNGIAWLQATCPGAEFRDGEKAVENATKACELTNWKNAGNLNTLAASYAEAGDFDEAIKWQQTAIDLIQEKIDSLPEGQPSGWVTTRAEYESRLKLYQSGKPYRKSLSENQ